MDEKTKRLVDEYQDWWTRHQEWDDLKAVRRVFALFVPTWIKNKTGTLPALPKDGGSYDQWSTGDNLPFPPTLVEGITEEDIKALQETFGLRDIDRYSHWMGVYRKANERFIESGEHERAREIVSEIKALEHGRMSRCKLTSASLFSMSAQAHLSECNKKEEIERRRNDRGKRERERTQREIKKSLETFKRAAEDLGQKMEEALSVGLDFYCSQKILQEVIDRLGEKMDQEIKTSCEGLKEASNLFLVARSVPKTMSPKDLAWEAFAAFQGIAKLISRARGRDYGAKTDASRLLSRWGIDIKTDTAKKKRQKKNRD